MTLPTGTVFLSQVITEFGPTGPSPSPNLLSSYKKSPTGPYVGVSPGTSTIPSTNPVYLHSFGGESSGNPGTYTSSTAGSGVVSIPSGTISFTVEAWGGGGGGGISRALTPPFNAGGGGGSGAYASYTLNLPTPYSNYWGQTFNYTVGAGGISAVNGTSSTVSGGTFSPFTLLFAGGGNRGNNGSAACTAPGGAGGRAGGGPAGSTLTTGTTGNPGCSTVAGTGLHRPTLSPAVGCGGTGGTGNGGAGTAGKCGAVRFTWS